MSRLSLLTFSFNFSFLCCSFTISQDGQLTSKIYNTHIIINNKGEHVAAYRKLHLFDVDTADFKFRESSVVEAGDAIVAPIADTPIGGKLGLMIVRKTIERLQLLVLKASFHVPLTVLRLAFSGT